MELCREGNSRVAARYFNRREVLFDEGSIGSLPDPKEITNQDLYQLLFYTNAVWAKGFGAVPFPIYLELKVRHLELKIGSAKGRKSFFLTFYKKIISAFRWACVPFVPKSQSGPNLERTIMRYIRKNADYMATQGEDILKDKIVR